MILYNENYKHIKIEKKLTHQLWITLDNETQSNAITIDMIESLKVILPKADFDPEIRVIVITGSGKNFCSGGDIKAMEEQSGMFAGESNELRMRYMYGIQQIPKTIEEFLQHLDQSSLLFYSK